MLKRILLIICCIIYLFLCGCTSVDKYNIFMSNYYDTFCSVAENVDIRNTYDSIERLQSKQSKANIEKLGELLAEIKDKVTNSRKHHYSELETLYEGLVFLRDTYDKWDKLTLDEQRKINVEMMRVDYYYNMYKKKK